MTISLTSLEREVYINRECLHKLIWVVFIIQGILGNCIWALDHYTREGTTIHAFPYTKLKLRIHKSHVFVKEMFCFQTYYFNDFRFDEPILLIDFFLPKIEDRYETHQFEHV